ncbi:hypothetical protein JMUB6875_48560 [Nocardia sp. JMUB6875]|uniref:CGNR zinc finger domain-containing protein n=1 Tax=Nocardia sp. JMUB6875 TaxID=3158170 RepID=UPI0032E53C55
MSEASFLIGEPLALDLVNTRRRWCSPQRCGNRIRVARYYDRHTAAKRSAPQQN